MAFCRFGFEEQLTLEDVRTLINHQELKADDLLQVGDTTQWKRAREIAVLQPYFPEVEPPSPRVPDQAAVRRKFEPHFTPRPPLETNRSEDVAKGITGIIFVIVGLGLFFSSAGALFKEFDVSALTMSLGGLAFAAWGVVAIVRPDKVSIGD